MEQQQSSFKEKERIELREPRRFKVTIYNDDFTTMEFVVKVLTTVFYKSSVEAETLMLQVHKSNSAVVGIYSYDIAHSKVQNAINYCRNPSLLALWGFSCMLSCKVRRNFDKKFFFCRFSFSLYYLLTFRNSLHF